MEQPGFVIVFVIVCLFVFVRACFYLLTYYLSVLGDKTPRGRVKNKRSSSMQLVPVINGNTMTI